MHGHQLSLKVRRKFGDREAGARHRAANLVAVRLALRRSLQIKQSRIPAGNLHAFVAELGGPRSDALQAIERRRIAAKLRQKTPRPLYRPHVPSMSHKSPSILPNSSTLISNPHIPTPNGLLS